MTILIHHTVNRADFRAGMERDRRASLREGSRESISVGYDGAAPLLPRVLSSSRRVCLAVLLGPLGGDGEALLLLAFEARLRVDLENARVRDRDLLGEIVEDVCLAADACDRASLVPPRAPRLPVV